MTKATHGSNAANAVSKCHVQMLCPRAVSRSYVQTALLVCPLGCECEQNKSVYATKRMFQAPNSTDRQFIYLLFVYLALQVLLRVRPVASVMC